MTAFTGFSQCLTVSVCSCQCPLGWKGALCSETVSVCDVEHSPPPLCVHGSTCIPLPNGYTCQCPLGTAGLHCEKGRIIEPLYCIIIYIYIFYLFHKTRVFTIQLFNCSIVLPVQLWPSLIHSSAATSLRGCHSHL